MQAGMMLASTAHMKSFRCLSDTYNAAVITLQVYLPHRMPKCLLATWNQAQTGQTETQQLTEG